LENQKKVKIAKGQPEKKKIVDPDPEGKTLVEADALASSSKYMQILQIHASKDIETQLLAFELYMKKGKYLLVLKSLKRALFLSPDHPKVHLNILKFFNIISNQLDSFNPTVKQLINSERNSILGENTLEEYSKKYVEKYRNAGVRYCLGVAESFYYINPSNKPEAIKIATNLNEVTATDLNNCINVYRALTIGEFADEKASKEYKLRCRNQFPLATEFMDENEFKLRIQIPQEETN